MAIPEVLALLTQYGIRQADLVQRLHVSRSFVSDWFRGKKPMPPSRLRDFWDLAALARDEIAAGGQGRDALARWHPTTIMNRRQSAGQTSTSTWHLSSPPARWPRPQTVEDYERFGLALGVESLLPFAGPEWARIDPDAATLEGLRQGVEMLTQSIYAMQERRAKLPLPRQEHA